MKEVFYLARVEAGPDGTLTVRLLPEEHATYGDAVAAAKEPGIYQVQKFFVVS